MAIYQGNDVEENKKQVQERLQELRDTLITAREARVPLFTLTAQVQSTGDHFSRY
jgi:hypothetical protein